MPREHESPAGNGANEVIAGRLDYSNFTPTFPIDEIYEARLRGWSEGRQSRQAEVERIGQVADRLYAEMCRRAGRPFLDPNQPTYAQLEQTRADIYGGKR